MNLMISITMIYLALPMILTLLNYSFTLAKRDNEKLSPYECGFDPLKTTRPPFSIRFFLSSNFIPFIWFSNRTTTTSTMSHSTPMPNLHLYLSLHYYITTNPGSHLWMSSGGPSMS
uniref:NADH-ubiquinone oxidoreductase chain 3 n=1 Tax=Cuora mccordi TaxID=241437 RepID=A0A342LHX3_9SAUR|nr:NADH dehydrogenase subunit 3 [Cuora mccordi]